MPLPIVGSEFLRSSTNRLHMKAPALSLGIGGWPKQHIGPSHSHRKFFASSILPDPKYREISG
jgi:hypothetical protein